MLHHRVCPAAIVVVAIVVVVVAVVVVVVVVVVAVVVVAVAVAVVASRGSKIDIWVLQPARRRCKIIAANGGS